MCPTNPTPQTPAGATYTIEIATVIAARPATIYRFFADPERFSQWLAAKATYEPRAGSPLRIEFPPRANREYSVMQGEILALEPNRRIAFSWGYAEAGSSGLAPGSTQVEITLQPHDDGTLVTLCHRGLPNEKERQEHVGGWKHYVCQLSVQSTQAELSSLAAASVRNYFEAWNEADADRRRQLLDDACQRQIRFTDSYALVEGVADLDQHIELSQRMLMGARLELASDVQLCHSHARFGWKCTGPNGATLFKGVNFGSLGADGRFKSLVGFWDA